MVLRRECRGFKICEVADFVTGIPSRPTSFYFLNRSIHMEIDILPLESDVKIPKALLTKLAAVLVKKDIKTRILKAEKIPNGAWEKSRSQYDAHKILVAINKRGVLAITAEDMFEDGLNFVYGLADTEGSAVVSYFRLRPEFYGSPENEKTLVERLAKEAMHEVGHTLGIKHCTNQTNGKPCAMTFSTNIHEVDAKADKFCREHAKMLE